MTAANKKNVTESWINVGINAGILFVYGALTLIGILNHELWIDEAQAWNIARDNNLSGILAAMKYEGHPPLWHFILYVFAHMGLSCMAVSVISWCISVASVAVILYKFPFALPLKLTIIFSSGFLFYNSVVSRVYCLVILLLCIIAVMYGRRREHPVLFGFLVALLANTHICICGIVGAIGIIMITDLFKGWKNNSKKENIMSLIGLGIAGIGVLLLVGILFNSMGYNSDIGRKSYSFYKVIDKIIYSLEDISYCAIFNSTTMNMGVGLILLLAELCFIAMLVLLWRWRRAFFIEMSFIVFYIITCEVIWFTLPGRAALFIFSYAFSLCIAYGESASEGIKCTYSGSSHIVKRLVEDYKWLHKHALRAVGVMLAVVCALTVPAGASYLFGDYSGDFNVTKKSAEFVRANIEKDAVLVSNSDNLVEISAYLPEYKMYSFEYADYYTYVSHKKHSKEIDVDKIKNELSRYEHIYYVYTYLWDGVDDCDKLSENIIFMADGGMKMYANMNFICIAKVDIDQLEDIAGRYSEYLKDN